MDYVIYTCAVSIQGIASFVPLAEAAGICIAVSEKILRAEDADYIDDRIVERLCFRNPAPEVSSYMFMSGRRPLFSGVMAPGILLFFWTTVAGPGETTMALPPQSPTAESRSTSFVLRIVKVKLNELLTCSGFLLISRTNQPKFHFYKNRTNKNGQPKQELMGLLSLGGSLCRRRQKNR